MQMVVKTTTTPAGGTATTTTETLNFTYDASGTPMSVKYGSTYYYYVTNIQGDVVALLNTSGTAVVEYTYDAWGNIHSITGNHAPGIGKINPLTYRGYVYDSEIGYYYLQSRYYDPEMGRFINADGLIASSQGLLGNNMFAYCINNPIAYSDPTGLLTRRQIHDKVLEEIIKEKIKQARATLRMEKTCIYKNGVNYHGGWGFCDLYDYETGEVWELKRVTCDEAKAKNQLAGYTAGVLKEYPDMKLHTGGELLTPGEEYNFTYQDSSGTYYITYWDGGNGILWYDYTYEKSDSRKKSEAALALGLTTVTCVAIGGAIVASGGSAAAAAPPIIQFVCSTIEYFSNAA